MRRTSTLIMVILLAVFIATPALAKPTKENKARKAEAAAYKEASKAEKAEMRDAVIEKAAKIHQKRDSSRQKVDELMQERLKNIQSDSPGNIGPIGG